MEFMDAHVFNLFIMKICFRKELEKLFNQWIIN